ncbi:MAG: class I SAM-dependent methyltransferase [Candidatus Sulfotelmatobacter sp.]
MSSVSQNFMKLFRGSSGPETVAAQGSQKLTRRSSGLGELSRTWESGENLCILDLGSTSPTNIRHFTENGHRIYSEDLLTASTDPELVTKDEFGTTALDSRKFLADNLIYPAAHFDVVLCWNLPDYLDESLVKPVVGRLWSVLKPGGMLLAFFHTRDAGPDSPCHRYHIVGADTLEMQKIVLRREAPRTASGNNSASDSFQLQRVFNNRHIENLFRDFASIKFFLARDNIREVLVIR